MESSAQSARFVSPLASISAFVAVFLGWLLAWSGGYEGRLVISQCGGIFGRRCGSALLLLAPLEHSALYHRTPRTLAILVWTADKGGKLTPRRVIHDRHMPDSLRSLLHVRNVPGKVQPTVKAAGALPAAAVSRNSIHHFLRFRASRLSWKINAPPAITRKKERQTPPRHVRKRNAWAKMASLETGT